MEAKQTFVDSEGHHTVVKDDLGLIPGDKMKMPFKGICLLIECLKCGTSRLYQIQSIIDGLINGAIEKEYSTVYCEVCKASIGFQLLNKK